MVRLRTLGLAGASLPVIAIVALSLGAACAPGELSETTGAIDAGPKARGHVTERPAGDAALEEDGSVVESPSDGGIDAGAPPEVDAGAPPGMDSGPPPEVDAGPAWIVGGEARCPEAASVRGTATDATAVLQTCLDRTPAGMALALEAGRYSLGGQLRLDRAITLRTLGSAGTGACAFDGPHACAELFLLPSFDTPLGAFLATAAVTIDHVVIDGNRFGRGSGHAHTQCATLADNSYGFNAAFACSGCTLAHSVSKNALCGTGFLVAAPASHVTIDDNTFSRNGVHTTRNMWSDGLTVHDAADSTFTNNRFVDNTDIDLIFGGCQRCGIRGNWVGHTDAADGGAFAAIMIQKWPSTSGNYADVDISGNTVDCGPRRNCGSGLYIGSESWYPETPYGTLVDGTTSGLITGNSVFNAKNALYIAARGLAIYGNGFVNAHGVSIPNSCHRSMTSTTPIVVSPTTRSCHFNLENIDPVMRVHYSSASWAGCIPNYPF